MPTIIAKVPQGVFDAPARARLARGLTAAAKAAEQGGDDPRHALVTWVLIDEVAPGGLFAGGGEALERMIPVVVLFHYPQGVLDDPARALAVRLIQEAAAAAKPAADPRPVMTSAILTEVADGTWGATGVLWRLPDFAKAAGFKHLQHLVPA
ncbi:hypothetical protein BH11PSE1_BH11PSE1_11840 [soil metagenome]